MIDVADIQELYRYNQWANDRAFEAASGLTLEECTRDLGNSYRSVRDTLTHIVWAERIWLQRWKGTSPQHRLDAAEFPDVNALNTRWMELKTGFQIPHSQLFSAGVLASIQISKNKN